MNWNEVYQRGLTKVNYMFNELKGQFPHITEKGKWLTSPAGHWTGGFWTGLLWMHGLYPDRGGQRMEMALDQAMKLVPRADDNKTHDMGFIFGPSCVWGSRLTVNNDLVLLALKGANNLKHLYAPQSNVIYAWDEPSYRGISIVDTVMNLPILIWASEKSKETQLKDIAVKVAEQISINHIREDFSTYHVVAWNPETHQIVQKSTHQGYSSDSCWSRGQAWALYGFANMYRYTRKERFLSVAQSLAEYFWNHLDEENKLPKWDFIFQNKTDEPVDASAAAIAASGILLISQILKGNNNNDYTKWRTRGEELLEALVKNCFYYRLDEYGILRNVTVDKPHNSGIGESSIYGDYYFMEAIFRILNENNPKALNDLY